MLYERMLSEHTRLTTQITALKEQLKALPPGKLICAKNGTNYKWYQNNGSGKIYIPKKDRTFAQQLALRKYLTLTLNDLENEQKAIQFYLNHHLPSHKAEKLLASSSEFQALLSPHFTPLSQELSEWQNAPYVHNTSYPEQLIHKSISGRLLRSKSEAMIDMFLYENKIPYRYESALQLGDTTLFPDFTIRHPQTGVLFYWEHFGLMDNPAYSRNAYSKMQLYNSHGIIPSIHLITTYETQMHPLSMEVIEKIVEHYFL